jgi:hypothetical protein
LIDEDFNQRVKAVKEILNMRAKALGIDEFYSDLFGRVAHCIGVTTEAIKILYPANFPQEVSIEMVEAINQLLKAGRNLFRAIEKISPQSHQHERYLQVIGA